MKHLIYKLICLGSAAASLLSVAPHAAASDGNAASVITAVGAGGTEEYAEGFSAWAAHWEKAAAAAGARSTIIPSGEKESLIKFRTAVQAETKEGDAPLWIVLLGHGTHDGREAKFNLTGDDLSASEFAELVKPITRPLVIVCGFSASGAFLKPLSAEGRVIVTATRSGSESNYSRFGGFFSDAIANPAADLDKDGQTSVLEAWLFAAQGVADFYSSEGRLATEHSLLDDNGDGLGTPPDLFKGVRVVKKPKGDAKADGARAHQMHLLQTASERELPAELRTRRDALELELAKLRDVKSTLPEEEYYGKLEAILLKIAAIYRETEKQE